MRIVLSFVLVILLSGCVHKAQNPNANLPAAKSLQHTVNYSGETLGLISKWYTGSPDNWKAIASHNPKLQVTRLRIGDTVDIPFSLIKTVQPLPKRMTSGSVRKVSTAKKTKPPVVEVSNRTEIEKSIPEVEVVAEPVSEPDNFALTQPVTEPVVAAAESSVSAVAAPITQETVESNVTIDESGKSVDQLLEEERAAVERLKQELNPPSQ